LANKRVAQTGLKHKRTPSRKHVVSLEEATEQVRIALTRAALLHLAFSTTLVEELGEERGKELILRAIMEYGRRVGERVKRGLPDLPKYGVIEREESGGTGNKWFENYKAYDCVFARTFKEYGELDLGSLYCYVDPAKSMAADPDRKLIHRDCAACGDEYCTFEVLPTTEEDRAGFANKRSDWKNVDPRLAVGVPQKSRMR
jgi:predicted hydrocarbon binding protein